MTEPSTPIEQLAHNLSLQGEIAKLYVRANGVADGMLREFFNDDIMFAESLLEKGATKYAVEQILDIDYRLGLL